MNKRKIQRLYITGGKWKKRKLIVGKKKFPIYLKPTSHKMRETLFNWLNFKINASNCLDCFAGSGSLGLEALSRGANNVIFIEKDIQISKYLMNIINVFNINKAKLFNINFFQWIKKSKLKFDVIFIDPPFFKNKVNKTIYTLKKNNVLSYNAFIYIEIESQYTFLDIPKNWILHREKRKKRVTHLLYTYLP